MSVPDEKDRVLAAKDMLCVFLFFFWREGEDLKRNRITKDFFKYL